MRKENKRKRESKGTFGAITVCLVAIFENCFKK